MVDFSVAKFPDNFSLGKIGFEFVTETSPHSSHRASQEAKKFVTSCSLWGQSRVTRWDAKGVPFLKGTPGGWVHFWKCPVTCWSWAHKFERKRKRRKQLIGPKLATTEARSEHTVFRKMLFFGDYYVWSWNAVRKNSGRQEQRGNFATETRPHGSDSERFRRDPCGPECKAVAMNDDMSESRQFFNHNVMTMKKEHGGWVSDADGPWLSRDSFSECHATVSLIVTRQFVRLSRDSFSDCHATFFHDF